MSSSNLYMPQSPEDLAVSPLAPEVQQQVLAAAGQPVPVMPGQAPMAAPVADAQLPVAPVAPVRPSDAAMGRYAQATGAAVDLLKGDAAAADQALGAQAGAAKAQAQVDTDRANDEKAIYEDLARGAAEHQMAQKAVQTKYFGDPETGTEGLYQQKIKNYEKASNDLVNDPALNSTFWDNQGISGRIGWGIALGLGAAAANMGRGGNPVMQIFKEAVENDASTRWRKQQLMQQRVAGLRSSAEMTKDEGREQQLFLKEQQALGYAAIEGRLKATAAKFGSQQVNAKLAATLADIQMVRAKTQTERDKLLGGILTDAAGKDVSVALAQENMDSTREWHKMVAELKAQGKHQGHGPAGFSPVQDPIMGRKLTAELQGHNKIANSTNAIEDLLTDDAIGPNGEKIKVQGPNRFKSVARRMLDPTWRAQFQGLLGLQVLEAVTKFGRGANLAANEEKLVKAANGNDAGAFQEALSTINPESFLRKLRYMEARSKDNVLTAAQALGAVPLPGVDPFDAQSMANYLTGEVQ